MNTEKKLAWIWKKSIYDNGFRCTRCGALLFDAEKNRPTDGVGFDPAHPWRNFCVKCKLPVAVTQEYDGPEPPGIFGHVTNARGRFHG